MSTPRNDTHEQPGGEKTSRTADSGLVRNVKDAVIDAMTDAELATGEREPDEAAARTHIALRVARGCAGALTVALGIALTVLPGPGILLILAGLGILAVDYPFAARLRDRLLEQSGKAAGRAGRIVKRLAVLGAALLVVGIVLVALVIALVVILAVTLVVG